MKRLLAMLFLCAMTPPAAAQWLTLQTPGVPRTEDGEPDLTAPAPRTADGRPDLSGLWAPRRVRGDLPESDKFKPWIRALMEERGRRFNAGNPRNHCLPSGPGYLTEATSSFGTRRIVQSPDLIVFLYGDMNYRQIFMDGRELEADPFPTWMGYSVGKWDGDVFVVESNGYNDKTWLHRLGIGHSEQLRIRERYQRDAFGSMQVDIVYDDPGAFEAPLEVSLEMRFVADQELMEVVCNESTVGTQNYTGDWEDVEADLVEIDPAVLEKYVGAYRGKYLDSDITVVITLEDGVLYLQRNRTEPRPLVPQGETTFILGGWGYVFTVDESGVATALSEVHVSGGWTFDRVE